MKTAFEMVVRRSEVDQIRTQIRAAEEKGLEGALNVILAKVRDWTPRLRGGMVRETTSEQHGLEGRVYAEGVVPWVHEYNAQWTKQPPPEAMRQWVEEKFGLSGKEAKSVAFLVGRKIKRQGLTLPNKEGRGQMYKRTQEEMSRTHFHFRAFMAAFQRAMPQGLD